MSTKTTSIIEQTKLVAQPVLSNSDPWRNSKIACRDIFAGTVAGITVTLVGHPFDTLKIRLQTQPQGTPLYNGMLDCVKKTIAWEGPAGLYKGVTSPLAGQMFFRANLFFSFAEAKRFLASYHGRPNTIPDFFVAGAFGWAMGTLVECPIDLVKSQLQVQIIKSKTIPGYSLPYDTMLSCAKSLVRTNGIAGLYQGVVPHLIRNIPAGSIHLGSFELTKHYFAKKKGVKTSELNMMYNMLGGGIGGFLYWFLFFPIDVVKSSIQTDNIIKEKRKYKTVVSTAKMLWQEGGWRRFYKGFTPCLIRSVPANAIMLFTVALVTESIPIK